MIGRQISHYRVLELLGAGGMGVVYKALDTKLDRQVALKFLPPQIGNDPELQRRFVNEAKAASALDHPGICTIYEIDEDENGQLFIVMAYYAGFSLRSHLDRSRMPIRQALDIALQTADALERAHEQGIIHRDIKPANLILTDRGEVKILDFGLAKVVGGAKLTQSGTSMGTLNYMSPEQLKGETVDVGTDIWALGAVLYEMLAGRLAFDGDNQGAVVVNILNSHPEPIEPTGTGIDVGFERFIGRCLAKGKAGRYPSMAEVKEDLKSLIDRTKSSANKSERHLHDDDQPTIPLDSRIAREVQSDSPGPALQPPFSVAVLDFSNIAADPEADWLSGGISESLAVDLNKIGSIKVIGQRAVRTAIGSLAASELDRDDLVDLGLRIGSRWMIWGAYQKSGDAIRVTAHCFDVEQRRSVDTLKVDGTMAQIFQLQDAIVTGLMKSFELELSEMERDEIEKPQTRDLEAYEYCAKARQILNRMAGPEMKQAQTYLEKAIDLDSQYAFAYSTLGQLHSFRFIAETDNGDLEDATRYLNRAIQLDPALSDPYAWLTYVYSRKGMFQEAIEVGNQAVELEPDNPQAHYFLAVGYWLRGLIDYDTEGYPEAAGHLKQVIELVPRYQPGSQILGVLYFACGQYEQAWEHLQRAAQIEESGDFELGRFVGAISLLARLAYRRCRFDEAESLTQRGLEISGSVDHVYTPACNALTYCTQGDVMLVTQRPDEALAAFRQAREQVLGSRRSLGSGWPMVRALLGQARAYCALGMRRELEAHMAQAKELLDSRSGFDFSGIWDGGRGELLVELALAYSVSHDQESATQCLEDAVGCGWRETARLDLDRGFGSLQARPQWQHLRMRFGTPQAIP